VGLGLLVQSFTLNETFATAASVLSLVVMAYGIPKVDGFNTHTPADQIAASLRKMKSEGFRDTSDEEEAGEEHKKEGFFSTVTQNINRNGYGVPGFGMGAPSVEGYEDVKKEKETIPAPISKHELPMPFKLGEIPSQSKNGPHIDAGSTLIKAIQGLNPNQINAMTKDTQQLIETQKSLMNMLGSMKPMLNDGKQLMETFQQMFGQ
jgi:hypothetical protein